MQACNERTSPCEESRVHWKTRGPEDGHDAGEERDANVEHAEAARVDGDAMAVSASRVLSPRVWL